MALTLTPVRESNTVFGNKRVRVFDVEFSGSSDSESLAPEDVGLVHIDQAIPSGGPDFVTYDFANEELVCSAQDGEGRVTFIGY